VDDVIAPVDELSDVELLARLRDLVRGANETEADLLEHLGEVDARRLYLEQACSSMFTYCVRVLHFAEGVAYKRIQAARAARSHPEVLEALRRGDLHLTAVSLLVPKLDRENCVELIGAARHKSADEIRRLLADREPRPSVATTVRRLPPPAVPTAPLPAPPRPEIPPARPAVTEPLGAQRYRVQFTADGETREQLEELRALMRHQFPDGDVGKILSRAIAVLLTQIRKQKFAETSDPRLSRTAETSSRHIPARIRRAVWQRDAGRCTYRSAEGRRCESREFVEFDHIDAWSRSREHSIEGITLRCRAHNQLRARTDFGEQHMARFHRGELDLNPVADYRSP
jgi:5-methylcytosine-specific restriction endonuclease McrA